ncbi:MAG: hypothetical protein IT514_15680 [Burkholderiales bacterium]|nr:hypothetical protein [Burkholderiales bacterium]
MDFGNVLIWATILIAVGILLFGIWALKENLRLYFSVDRPLGLNRMDRFELIASSYGRIHGWYVEYEGQRIAELEDPQYADMFWESYKVTLIQSADAAAERPLEPIKWCASNR